MLIAFLKYNINKIRIASAKASHMNLVCTHNKIQRDKFQSCFWYNVLYTNKSTACFLWQQSSCKKKYSNSAKYLTCC